MKCTTVLLSLCKIIIIKIVSKLVVIMVFFKLNFHQICLCTSPPVEDLQLCYTARVLRSRALVFLRPVPHPQAQRRHAMQYGTLFYLNFKQICIGTV